MIMKDISWYIVVILGMDTARVEAPKTYKLVIEWSNYMTLIMTRYEKDDQRCYA